MSAFHSLWHTDIPAWSLVIRAIVTYGAVLLLLRLGGKRQVAQMSMTELVALLLISNAVQNSMNGGDNSLIGGILLAVVLIVLATALAYATYRNPRLEQIVHGRPTMLIHKGKLVRPHLARELMTVKELRQILRRQGITLLEEVEEAVLESDGSVCVLKKNEPRDLYDEQPRNDVY